MAAEISSIRENDRSATTPDVRNAALGHQTLDEIRSAFLHMQGKDISSPVHALTIQGSDSVNVPPSGSTSVRPEGAPIHASTVEQPAAHTNNVEHPESLSRTSPEGTSKTAATSDGGQKLDFSVGAIRTADNTDGQATAPVRVDGDSKGGVAQNSSGAAEAPKPVEDKNGDTPSPGYRSNTTSNEPELIGREKDGEGRELGLEAKNLPTTGSDFVSDRPGNQPEDIKHLDQAREHLKKAVSENITSEAERKAFLENMGSFEEIARRQPLGAKDVADTYDQLSRLLEAKDGAVPKQDRVLAAETFAHHVGGGRVDQGMHNTCNVTSLERHLLTRSPGKAAEMVATMAIDGHWTAPDGRQAKIDAGSLVPGVEERHNPPEDNQRSYATQLMNLALINDIGQRKSPPEFYSQERPSGQGDLGERLRYADGRDVSTDDVLHNGDKAPWNKPDVSCDEISDEGTRINGDTKFLIANPQSDNNSNLVHVSNPAELGRALHDMNRHGKMPAIVLVDVNDPHFSEPGADRTHPNWHVLTVKNYDEKTGEVRVTNQWGQARDQYMTLEELYKATLPQS